MTQRLFVYGSLGPNGPNEPILSAIGGTWMSGSVRGHLKDVGWGSEIGYPGINLDPSGKTVVGHVFVSDNLQSHWKELDVFEGEEYERILTTVDLADHGSVEAYVYVLRE